MHTGTLKQALVAPLPARRSGDVIPGKFLGFYYIAVDEIWWISINQMLFCVQYLMTKTDVVSEKGGHFCIECPPPHPKRWGARAPRLRRLCSQYWNVTGLTLNSKRSSLSPYKLNMITFMCDNYHAWLNYQQSEWTLRDWELWEVKHNKPIIKAFKFQHFRKVLCWVVRLRYAVFIFVFMNFSGKFSTYSYRCVSHKLIKSQLTIGLGH